ncbi:MAG: CPBP family intramembrane metalloprotease [Clostridia bacterium]|nr:CPBP family intramembrane metalloprotease [Clostridia bacterium]
MANTKRKTKVSALCLIILVCLLALSAVQHFDLLKLRNWGVMLIYVLVFFLPMLIYTKTTGRKGKNLLRMRSVSVKYLPFIFLIGIAICLICGLLNILGAVVFTSVSTGVQPTALVDFTSQNPLVLFLTMVLLPAVTEEFLLRGIALSEYEQYGTVRAVMITSLIFALFHANPVTMLSLFVAGICFGVLTLLFDSVWPALIAHLLNNLAALLIAYHHDYITYILNDTLFIIFVVAAIFLLLIGVLKMLEKVIDQRGKNGKLRYYKRRTKDSPWRSICLWLFVAGCVAKMIFTYII